MFPKEFQSQVDQLLEGEAEKEELELEFDDAAKRLFVDTCMRGMGGK